MAGFITTRSTPLQMTVQAYLAVIIQPLIKGARIENQDIASKIVMTIQTFPKDTSQRLEHFTGQSPKRF